MFGNGPDKQLRATLAIVISMSVIWLLGIVALTLVPSDVGSRDAEGPVNFRYQATGATYAYQDATGQFTVYIRGSQRISAP